MANRARKNPKEVKGLDKQSNIHILLILELVTWGIQQYMKSCLNGDANWGCRRWLLYILM